MKKICSQDLISAVELSPICQFFQPNFPFLNKNFANQAKSLFLVQIMSFEDFGNSYQHFS